MGEWVRELLAKRDAGTDQPFAVVHLATGKIAGSTRYMDIRPKHRGLEIGGTWYGTAFQRTAVNTEAKYLLLRHAFEQLGCIRVQLKTDLRNERSQKAIASPWAIITIPKSPRTSSRCASSICWKRCWRNKCLARWSILYWTSA